MPASRPNRLAFPRRMGLAVCAAYALSGILPAIHSRPLEAANNLRRTPIVEAVEQAAPSVVNIHGRKTVRPETTGAETGKQVNGMGTGIIIDPRGYIITNHHVVDGVANIQATMSDDKSYVARLVAHDPRTDLAVIKIDSDKPLPVIRIGTSCDLMRGESVIAVGNAFGYEHTVTRGIVSALHRTVQVSDDQKYYDLIQTDASINPGNSGGPLLNIEGDAIGINVAVRVGAQGIGFAIPIDEALDVAAKLISIERLEGTMHGIEGKTLATAEGTTLSVRSVRRDSPAEKSGLMAGDVVTRVGDRAVNRKLDLELALLGKHGGDAVTIDVDRNGEVKQLSLSLEASNELHDEVASRIWEDLGLKLAPINEAEFRRLGTKYRGGLKVMNVRADSPAAQQGIRRGDALVGMHIWETLSLENVTYVLDREDLNKLQPVKFFIVRGTETLYGHLRVASRR